MTYSCNSKIHLKNNFEFRSYLLFAAVGFLLLLFCLLKNVVGDNNVTNLLYPLLKLLLFIIYALDNITAYTFIIQKYITKNIHISTKYTLSTIILCILFLQNAIF